MPEASPILFTRVALSKAQQAFAFHARIAESDDHIWPRTGAQIEKLASEGLLFGAYLDANELVALCYMLLDEAADTWEIGGLTVSEQARRHGIGTFLVRLAIAHTVVYETPFQNGQAIVAHVHEANANLLPLIEKLGFVSKRTVEIPGASAPASIGRNDAGNVVGHEYHFSPAALIDLASWLDGFDGTIPPSGKNAQIVLGALQSMEDFRRALSLTAQEFGTQS